MPELRVQYTREATEDLDRIWDYTEEVWSLEQAERYVTTIRDTILMLSDMPMIAKERTDLSPPLRMYPIAKHWVFFEVTGDTLTVIRILAQRQDWQAILNA